MMAMTHLIAAPILLPLLTAAIMLMLGEVHLASALFFDIGVYAVVVGSTLLILTALAHQSVRSHRPTSLPQPIEPAPGSPASPATSQGAI